MKFVFLFGGAAGFSVGALASFEAGRAPDRVLFDGAVGCLAGALLFRWCWSILLRGIRETYLERRRAAAAAVAASAPAPAPAIPSVPSTVAHRNRLS